MTTSHAKTSTPLASIEPWRWVALIAVALLAAYAAVLWMAAGRGLWVTDGHGGLARTDFSEFWGAGRLALSGRAAAAYSWPALRGVLEQHAPGAFAHDAFPFFYPPFLLLLLAPLATAPPVISELLWIAGGYAAYLAALAQITRRPEALLAAAAAPAAFMVVCVGQNGLLSAALLAGGLALLDRRPWLAGVLIGVLAYKPQFGVLVPVALVAMGRWRTVAAACLTVLAMALASGWVFGWDVYPALLRASRSTHGQVVALTLTSAKLQSVYGLALSLGASGAAAWAVQLLVAATAVVLIARLWRSGCGMALKSAALCASVLLVSPYSAVYDLTFTVAAIAFLLGDSQTLRLGAGEGVVLGLIYLAPLSFPFAPSAMGPVLCIGLWAVVAARWRSALRPAIASAVPAQIETVRA